MRNFRREHYPEPDAELVAAAQAGDRAACQALYKHVGTLVDRFLRLLRPREDLDDLAADVAAEVFVALPRFRRKAEFRSFVFAVAFRRLLNHERSERRFEVLREVARILLGRGPTPAGEEDAALSPPDRLEAVLKAMAHLKPKRRAALVLVEVEGMRIEEVARVLGTSSHSARGLVRRARSQLRDWLRGQGYVIPKPAAGRVEPEDDQERPERA